MHHTCWHPWFWLRELFLIAWHKVIYEGTRDCDITHFKQYEKPSVTDDANFQKSLKNPNKKYKPIALQNTHHLNVTILIYPPVFISIWVGQQNISLCKCSSYGRNLYINFLNWDWNIPEQLGWYHGCWYAGSLHRQIISSIASDCVLRKHVIVFYQTGHDPPVQFQCREMIGNVNMFCVSFVIILASLICKTSRYWHIDKQCCFLLFKTAFPAASTQPLPSTLTSWDKALKDAISGEIANERTLAFD